MNALLAQHCPHGAIASRPFRPRIAYQLGIATVAQAAASPLHDTFTQLLVEGLVSPPGDAGAAATAQPA